MIPEHLSTGSGEAATHNTLSHVSSDNTENTMIETEATHSTRPENAPSTETEATMQG
jgi:hypothetical protein